MNIKPILFLFLLLLQPANAQWLLDWLSDFFKFWVDLFCSSPVLSVLCNHCGLDPCGDHGECYTEIMGTYACVCDDGWTGTDCDEDVDECSDSGLNNCTLDVEMCKNTDGGFECIRYCSSDPCLNGICIDGGGTYTCDCSGTDFVGDHCQIQIDDCSPDPCDNGGICIDGVNTYTCNCTGTGYTGVNCTENVDDCSPDPCENGGVCIDGDNGYTCNCTGTGYTGVNCTESVDNCSSNPCGDYASCQDGEDSFTCTCNEGFSGSPPGILCTVDVDFCASSPCGVHATCTSLPGSYVCACDEGFYGSPPNTTCSECAPNDRCCGDPCCNSTDPCCGSKDCSGSCIAGDPHLFTFDNLRYSCQARGEFVAFHALPSGAQVQERFEKKNDHVSLVTGVVVTAGPGSPTVQLSIRDNSALELFVNGTLVPSMAYKNSQVEIRNEGSNRYVIFFMAIKLSVQVRFIMASFRHLNVLVRLFDFLVIQSTEIKGLLGSPDQNATNDWIARDGSLLPIPMSLGELRDEAGYNHCLNWCISNASESYFVYPSGSSFSNFSGCTESYPGPIVLTGASDALLDRCGTNQACIMDGIELGLDSAQALLEIESEILAISASIFTVYPSAVQSGNATLVTLTIDLTTGSTSNITEFRVFDVDSETREPGTSVVATLRDDLDSFGQVAGDLIFSGEYLVLMSTAETKSFFAVPVINGQEEPTSEFSIMLLNAITSYSQDSGIGVIKPSDRTEVLTADKVEGLVLDIKYSWPVYNDYWKFESLTTFLGHSAPPYTCQDVYIPHQYMNYRETETLRFHEVRVFLGDAFLDNEWNNTWPAVVNITALWDYSYHEGLALLSVAIPGDTPVHFLINPGLEEDDRCNDFAMVGQAVVTRDDQGQVEIAITPVTNFCEADPCLHGTCKDGNSTFTCDCEDGWEGDTCGISIDDCPPEDEEPCSGNGYCIDGHQNYTCECFYGWHGDICDTFVN